MTCDEQLIQRIRTELRADVANLDPPADLMARLNGPARERQPAHLTRTRIGGLATLVLSAGVVVLVVVAIGAVSRNPQSPSSRPAAPPSLRPLASQFAILRRPQTAADRLPASAFATVRRLFPGQLVAAGLTRFGVSVTREPLATADIYVVVTETKLLRQTIESVRPFLVVGPPGQRTVRQGRSPDAPGASLVIGGSGAAAVGSPGDIRAWARLVAGAVPDGVARVSWVFSNFPNSTGRTVTINPRIRGNLAWSTTQAPLGDLESATWYDASGHAIASFTDSQQIARQQEAQQRLLSASSTRPVAAALLNDFEIFKTPPPAPSTSKPLPDIIALSLAHRWPYQLNIARARFVPYPGTSGVWVVPGTRGATMTMPDGQGFATDGVPLSGRASVLADHLITTTGNAPPRETIFGLAPNGNASVTLVLANGATRTVSVIDNVYSATVSINATTLIARDATGHMVRIRVPG